MSIGSLTDWHPLALAQKNVPGTYELAQRFTSQISALLAGFGSKVGGRIYPSVYFGITTFPIELRERYAYNQGYLISWVFALDELLDSCLSFDYAHDLQLLLARQLSLPPDAALDYMGLPLRGDAHKNVPGLPYSVFDLVAAIQPLRRRLVEKAQDPAGPLLFDRYLIEMVVPAMLREAGWRLGALPSPDFDTYVETATTSICGGLCVATLNAILSHPVENWQTTEQATNTMCRAVRLINELATRRKDEGEGKPNAVSLLAAQIGDTAEAERQVRQMIDQAAEELEELCGPLMQVSLDNPLYALAYYIYYSWVITEAMYDGGDFIAPPASK